MPSIYFFFEFSWFELTMHFWFNMEIFILGKTVHFFSLPIKWPCDIDIMRLTHIDVNFDFTCKSHKNWSKYFLWTFWGVLVTIIYDIKIDVMRCEPHGVKSFLWTSWLFDTWHIHDSHLVMDVFSEFSKYITENTYLGDVEGKLFYKFCLKVVMLGGINQFN